MAFTTSWFYQISLYKFRYLLGYGFVIILIFFMVLGDISTLPNGISQAEMNQAVTSDSLKFSLNLEWLINAPYHFLQKLSVEAFGLSRLSLVLPSLIFGTATIVIFALTMKHWFKDTVAIVSTVIAATCAPFIGALRGATPDIMLPFWTIILLYGAVRLLIKRDHAFHWKLIIVLANIGLLYTPYGIYPVVAIFGSALFHPHVRSRLRHIRRKRIMILSAIMIIGALPLGIYFIRHPEAFSVLTGAEDIRNSFIHFRQNLAEIYDMYLNLRKNGFSGTQIIPLYNMATLALIVLGVLTSLRDRYTARSYVLLSWATMTIATTLLMSKVAILTFLPALLLAAIGINTLVIEWYKLFPRNPYARFAGLLPLTILFIGIGLGNLSHYFNNHNHIANPHYAQSLLAIQRSLVVEGNHAVILLTAQNELAFYKILQKEHPYLTVATALPTAKNVPIFVLPNSQVAFSAIPSRIVTTSTKDESAVLRIYRQ